MKIIVKTIKGLEEAAIKEIKEKYKINSKKITKGIVYFESDDIKELRSINAIYELISKFKFKDKKDLINNIKKIKFSIENDFLVRCNRDGIHNFSSLELEKEIGEIIYEKGNKVNLKSDNIIYIDIIDDYCFVGKLIKKDLCKRFYRLRTSQGSMNGCLAYSILILSNYNKNDLLVDPFCGDGTLLIEAGFIGGDKIFGFDNNLYNLKNAEVNSKLAKIKINLVKEEIEKLDKTFKKKEVDKIITKIFVHQRNKNESIKRIKELFYQCDIMLKDSLTILSNTNLSKYKGKFKLLKKYKIKIGDNDMELYIFGI